MAINSNFNTPQPSNAGRSTSGSPQTGAKKIQAQLNFNGGMVSELFTPRVDIEKYNNCCTLIRNFIPRQYGALERRKGMRLIDSFKTPVRLINWKCTSDKEYIVAIHSEDVYKSGGCTPFATIYDTSDFNERYEIEKIDFNSFEEYGINGWKSDQVLGKHGRFWAEDLPKIKYVSQNDKLWLVHPDFFPLEITRSKITTSNNVNISADDYKTGRESEVTTSGSTHRLASIYTLKKPMNIGNMLHVFDVKQRINAQFSSSSDTGLKCSMYMTHSLAPDVPLTTDPTFDEYKDKTRMWLWSVLCGDLEISLIAGIMNFDKTADKPFSMIGECLAYRRKGEDLRFLSKSGKLDITYFYRMNYYDDSDDRSVNKFLEFYYKSFTLDSLTAFDFPMYTSYYGLCLQKMSDGKYAVFKDLTGFLGRLIDTSGYNYLSCSGYYYPTIDCDDLFIDEPTVSKISLGCPILGMEGLEKYNIYGTFNKILDGSSLTDLSTPKIAFAVNPTYNITEEYGSDSRWVNSVMVGSGNDVKWYRVPRPNSVWNGSEEKIVINGDNSCSENAYLSKAYLIGDDGLLSTASEPIYNIDTEETEEIKFTAKPFPFVKFPKSDNFLSSMGALSFSESERRNYSSCVVIPWAVDISSDDVKYLPAFSKYCEATAGTYYYVHKRAFLDHWFAFSKNTSYGITYYGKAGQWNALVSNWLGTSWVDGDIIIGEPQMRAQDAPAYFGYTYAVYVAPTSSAASTGIPMDFGSQTFGFFVEGDWSVKSNNTGGWSKDWGITIKYLPQGRVFHYYATEDGTPSGIKGYAPYNYYEVSNMGMTGDSQKRTLSISGSHTPGVFLWVASKYQDTRTPTKEESKTHAVDVSSQKRINQTYVPFAMYKDVWSGTIFDGFTEYGIPAMRSLNALPYVLSQNQTWRMFQTTDFPNSWQYHLNYRHCRWEYNSHTHNGGLIMTDLVKAAFTSQQGYPSCIALRKGRLIFASTKSQPQTIWASRVDNYYDFSVDDKADSGWDLMLDAQQAQKIRWMSSSKDLLVGTDIGEWVINDSSTTTAVPTITEQSRWGSSIVQGQLMTESTFFVPRDGRGLVHTIYSDGQDSYTSEDVSITVPELVENGIVSQAIQKDPDPVWFGVTGNGDVSGFLFNPKQQISGWFKWDFNGLNITGIESYSNNSKSQEGLALVGKVKNEEQAMIEYPYYLGYIEPDNPCIDYWQEGSTSNYNDVQDWDSDFRTDRVNNLQEQLYKQLLLSLGRSMTNVHYYDYTMTYDEMRGYVGETYTNTSKVSYRGGDALNNPLEAPSTNTVRHINMPCLRGALYMNHSRRFDRFVRQNSTSFYLLESNNFSGQNEQASFYPWFGSMGLFRENKDKTKSLFGDYKNNYDYSFTAKGAGISYAPYVDMDYSSCGVPLLAKIVKAKDEPAGGWSKADDILSFETVYTSTDDYLVQKEAGQCPDLYLHMWCCENMTGEGIITDISDNNTEYLGCRKINNDSFASIEYDSSGNPAAGAIIWDVTQEPSNEVVGYVNKYTGKTWKNGEVSTSYADYQVVDNTLPEQPIYVDKDTGQEVVAAYERMVLPYDRNVIGIITDSPLKPWDEGGYIRAVAMSKFFIPAKVRITNNGLGNGVFETGYPSRFAYSLQDTLIEPEDRSLTHPLLPALLSMTFNPEFTDYNYNYSSLYRLKDTIDNMEVTPEFKLEVRIYKYVDECRGNIYALGTSEPYLTTYGSNRNYYGHMGDRTGSPSIAMNSLIVDNWEFFRYARDGEPFFKFTPYNVGIGDLTADDKNVDDESTSVDPIKKKLITLCPQTSAIVKDFADPEFYSYTRYYRMKEQCGGIENACGMFVEYLATPENDIIITEDPSGYSVDDMKHNVDVLKLENQDVIDNKATYGSYPTLILDFMMNSSNGEGFIWKSQDVIFDPELSEDPTCGIKDRTCTVINRRDECSLLGWIDEEGNALKPEYSGVTPASFNGRIYHGVHIETEFVSMPMGNSGDPFVTMQTSRLIDLRYSIRWENGKDRTSIDNNEIGTTYGEDPKIIAEVSAKNYDNEYRTNTDGDYITRASFNNGKGHLALGGNSSMDTRLYFNLLDAKNVKVLASYIVYSADLV